MRKLEHINLFQYGDKNEVYEALQEHYDRDTWIHLWWHLVFVGCAFGAAHVSNHMDWLWLFGGMYAIERAICRRTDNSNRNWFMHGVDWIESGWVEDEQD